MAAAPLHSPPEVLVSLNTQQYMRLLGSFAVAGAALFAACDDAEKSPPPFTYEYTPTVAATVDYDDVDHGSCDACDANAYCAMRSDATVCVCKAGYAGDGLSCSDIDECAANVCSANANCTNTIGGFECSCNNGFTGNGLACNDRDECADAALNDCDANAFCTNEPNGFSCTCRGGFTGDGKACVDADECASATTNNCAANATCQNTSGSYACACNAGFAGNGRTCTDRDECTLGTANCNSNAACENTDGGFECTCNDGFEGDGVTCDEEDGCDPNPCDGDASCTNDGGAAVCDCNTGFEGSGMECTEIDGCAVGVNPCDIHAECASSLGVAVCACDMGYEGTGFTCTEIDGCAADVNPCDDNAMCTSDLGVAACECMTGYSGSGLICTLDGPMCEDAETICDESCVDTARDPSYCGDCDTTCTLGEGCAGGVCVDDGILRISMTWTREGDADLYVTTPSGKTIYWNNEGPGLGTDFGIYDLSSSAFGPETVIWPTLSVPPIGTYHVCGYAYDFFPTTDDEPVGFEIDVVVAGQFLTTFTGTMTQDDGDILYDPICDPTTPTFVGSFTLPVLP